MPISKRRFVSKLVRVGPVKPSYRIEFNPAKLSKEGLLELKAFLDTRIDADPVEFFRGGKVTRFDVAVDLPGFHLEDFIVRTSRLQKHGVYADRQGLIRTTYLGTPTSSRVVAYEKPLDGLSSPALGSNVGLSLVVLGTRLPSLQTLLPKLS